MTSRWFAVALFAFAFPASAQEIAPESCLAPAGRGAVSVEYGGKRYDFTAAACREQFLSDPERYAQLYDALRELEREGAARLEPATASLVPS